MFGAKSKLFYVILSSFNLKRAGNNLNEKHVTHLSLKWMDSNDRSFYKATTVHLLCAVCVHLCKYYETCIISIGLNIAWLPIKYQNYFMFVQTFKCCYDMPSSIAKCSLKTSDQVVDIKCACLHC